ncbi:MAG TPA: hypothetical protein QKA37_00170 [Candidatus Megaira endosymbiont of Stentor roeselii]|nr:hypothetical protein [Candidatus Megaera endosymbiont of Stentor roeselii]
MSKYIQDMLDRQAFIDQNMQKKNPFDEGIMRAVKSAKQSIGMDEEQSNRAMRNGLYGFSEALQQDQAPIGKGLFGKFAATARGVPARMRAYDQSETAARNENNLLADMARRFRAGEEAKIAKMEQDAYIRQMNDRKMALERKKFGEQRDYHNQSMLSRMANGARKKEIPFDKKHKLGMEGITRTIDDAIATINRNQALAEATGEDSKGEAGLLKRTINNNWVTQKGGFSIPLTPEQAEIQTLGSLLAGYGNKLMNYTNQAEFESLPHISPYNPDATNLAILKQMKKIMLRDAEHGGLDSGMVNVTPNTTEGLSEYGSNTVYDNVSGTPNNINDSDDFGDL